MKLFSAIFAVSLLVASTTIADAGGNALQSDNCDSGFPKTSVDSSGKQGVHIVQSGGGDQTGSSSTDASQNNPGQESPSQDNPDQNNPGQNTPDQNSTSSDGSQTQTPPVLKGDCILTGDYINNTDVRKCDSIIVDSLRVPPGVTLNLTKLQDNAKVSFKGTSTFGTKLWDGPLVKLQGNNLTVTGPGTLDGQGAYYWPLGQKVDKPVFFKIYRVAHSTLSGFTLLNVPYRTFSVGNSNYTTITGLTLNTTAGNGVAQNTDGFDLSKNDHITITKNRIFNQDDCLAMQSSTNTVFSDNYCCGSHGISIGSLGGPEQNSSTTVDGLTVTGNTIENSTNGIRIKTIIGLKGLVTNAVYTNNKLINVTNAIVMHSDYNKTKGGYAGTPTSLVKIQSIKIDGLQGTAENLYDIVANPDVVSDWTFTNIDVTAASIGNCTGEPSNVKC
ncbi:polygalacturonase [Phytophthora sojae]|uniref:endo-polygalacturonase n=1 Tax=Phytophthora sojae (strain P6497) TaxID=1094619 RepID=G4YJ91_PHYSP|nr:polygalacturonase [Phytophthora sojae]EGZ29425.1 polygalacturonase [Phytophthora sojae]|eukprot:XP_009516700.1 polygalacturonase [Phytophthora sojae]